MTNSERGGLSGLAPLSEGAEERSLTLNVATRLEHDPGPLGPVKLL